MSRLLLNKHQVDQVCIWFLGGRFWFVKLRKHKWWPKRDQRDQKGTILTDQHLSKIKSEQRVPPSCVLMKTQNSSISADESWSHLILFHYEAWKCLIISRVVLSRRARLLGKGSVHYHRDAMFFTPTAPCLPRKLAAGDQWSSLTDTHRSYNARGVTPWKWATVNTDKQVNSSVGTSATNKNMLFQSQL